MTDGFIQLLPDLRITIEGSPDSGPSTFELIGIGIAALTAGLTLFGAGRQLYRRTLGRRRGLERRLRRLGTGVQLGFFESILGAPPAVRGKFSARMRRYDRVAEAMVEEDVELDQCFFVDSEYYLQTISDDTGQVLGYSVTARGRRFQPRLAGPTSNRPLRQWRRLAAWLLPRPAIFRLKLGRTTFQQFHSTINGMTPASIEGAIGAQWYAYSEIYYFGRPGLYQHYVVTASSAVDHSRTQGLAEVNAALEGDHKAHPRRRRTVPDAEAIRRFRGEAAITTFSVIHQALPLDAWRVEFGPDSQQMRTIP